MSATIFGNAQYGARDDTSATGLHIASLSYTYSTEQAQVKNHLGNDVGLSVYNDKTEVSADGVVATKTTGLVPDLADVVTLANSTANSLDIDSDAHFTSSDANAGLVVTGGTLGRSNTDFETGSLSMLYCPLIATDSPTVVTD